MESARIGKLLSKENGRLADTAGGAKTKQSNKLRRKTMSTYSTVSGPKAGKKETSGCDLRKGGSQEKKVERTVRSIYDKNYTNERRYGKVKAG